MIAGGVKSMSRAPFVMGKAESAFSRNAAIFDTTIGWRFANPMMKKLYETHSMPQTADNVAADFAINRADQDAFAAVSGRRDVWMIEAGGFVAATLYDRAKLRPGNVVEGPAIIDQMDTTTVVPPAMIATVDAYLNFILEKKDV